nr:hypothetical protein GCM10020093_109080 [Planobispora longispora]
MAGGPAARADAGAGGRAGGASWTVLRHYIQGTLVIASIHAVVLGVAMLILGVPLALPLAVLIFFGSFIPFIGSLIAGSLAVVVALGARGLVVGLILLAVLLVENQLEEHVLEPWVMGSYVRIHPLVIGLALASGTILGGVSGALVSVPLTAIAYYGGRELLRSRPAGGPGRPTAPDRPRRLRRCPPRSRRAAGPRTGTGSARSSHPGPCRPAA